MKKRMPVISVLAIVVLLGIGFEFGSPRSSQARGDASDLSVWQSQFGLTSEQTARVTVANFSTGSNAQPLTFQCSAFDRNGTRVFMSARTEVRATRFGQVDVPYDSLDMDFEAGTGRKQVRMEVVIGGSSASMPDVLVSGEILNQATGTTHVIITSYSFHGDHGGIR